MRSRWLKERLDYDGSQLRSLFNYLGYGMLGPSILGFRGACSVSFDHMVDGEDLRQRAAIAGSDMLHFLVEFFHQNLFSAVAFQRLIADLAGQTVYEQSQGRIHLRREGDDLYFEDRKFSISIATVSPVSQLIHFAVNVSQKGTPVKTCALEDFGLEPETFAQSLMQKVVDEFQSVTEATQKVRPV